MTISDGSKTSAFELCDFQLEDADELAAFLNELRRRHWSLTSTAYQRKPERVPLLTGRALLQEQREHTNRIGHYLLRHNGRIIASLKIDDKYGDGRVAVCSDLETHPDFQRRGIAWFHFSPCVRNVIEMDYQWVEFLTWVFNRKGIPLYKRGGFRAVPGTSLLMQNYLPMIIRHPALRPYFRRNDYVRTLISQRSYGYDHLRYHDLDVFQYRWRAGTEMWEVLVDLHRGQIASIACPRWSIGAWIVQNQRLRVRIENRGCDEVVCSSGNRLGESVGAIRGETKQVDWEAGYETCIKLMVRVGRFDFPFVVRHGSAGVTERTGDSRTES